MLIYMIYDNGSDEDPGIKYAGTLKDANEAAKVLVYARGVHVLHDVVIDYINVPDKRTWLGLLNDRADEEDLDVVKRWKLTSRLALKQVPRGPSWTAASATAL